jgi:hypothetical protein
MRRIAAWGLSAALILLAGCGEPAGNIPTVRSRATPDLALKYAVESRASLSSLHGQGTMRIVDPNGGGRVNAEVLAAHPRRPCRRDGQDFRPRDAGT